MQTKEQTHQPSEQPTNQNHPICYYTATKYIVISVYDQIIIEGLPPVFQNQAENSVCLK